MCLSGLCPKGKFEVSTMQVDSPVQGQKDRLLKSLRLKPSLK